MSRCEHGVSTIADERCYECIPFNESDLAPILARIETLEKRVKLLDEQLRGLRSSRKQLKKRLDRLES